MKANSVCIVAAIVFVPVAFWALMDSRLIYPVYGVALLGIITVSWRDLGVTRGVRALMVSAFFLPLISLAFVVGLGNCGDIAPAHCSAAKNESFRKMLLIIAAAYGLVLALCLWRRSGARTRRGIAASPKSFDTD